MIVLLSGEKKNIGDFLITERARKLFAHLLDDEIIILDRFKNLESVFTPKRPTYNLNCRFSDLVRDLMSKNKLSF